MDIFVDPRNEARPAADARTNGSDAPTPPEEGWAAWYLRDEDDVGEGTEQGITVRTLLAALTELARERGWDRTLVAGDQFFAWVESEPLVRISPDVYLLDDPPPPPYPGMWRTWLSGQAPPRFAVEVVSDDWAKDYVQAPRKYQQLGTRELVVFDPEAALAPRERRVPLQVFRRDEHGALVRVAAGDGPVHSAELDAWLVALTSPRGARLRIARDAAGTQLVPTSDELVASLHPLIAELQGVIAVQKDLLAQQAALLAQQDARIAQQDALLAQQAAVIARLKSTVAAQEALLARYQANVAGQDALITRLQAAVAERDAHIVRQTAHIATLEATLAARDASLSELAATLTTREDSLAALTATLAARDERDLAMKNRIEALEAALSRLLPNPN